MGAACVTPEAVPAGYCGPHGVGSMRGYPMPNQPAEASRDAAEACLWDLSEDLTRVRRADVVGSPVI